MTTEVLNRLTINLLTKAQYNNAVISGDINPNELYLIKDADPIGDHNSALDAHATLFAAKADRSVVHSLVLYADDWTGTGPYTQTVTVTGLPAGAKGLIGLADTATAAQREAARDAMLIKTAQAAGSVTITADGDKPTINIPIVILEVG